ncbi:DUF7282 domain-containing protein [Halopiger djelfimassiliensis]|uniref:DUF7282 domain-containing protein n=1 Tax=Halopiger djelfimassiliensis TaxID=1293047 RepID=UPI0006780639|nr:hypothetical protein [Halopiger djelfimassiliensis]
MSSRPTFGTLKRIAAVLLAITIVLAAGIVVGQAPAIFGVEEDPEASITFEEQDGNGTSVTIDEVSLSEGGFVVVTDDGDDPIAVSDYLEAGTHENVTVETDEGGTSELVGRLTATVHRDTDDDGEYTYAETDGEEDRPYLEAGFPVSDTATVTTDEDGDLLTDSFTVDSMTTPETATTNDTINVTAEIHNPTDMRSQQPVVLRLDGTVLEQRLLELEGGESREETFEVDTTGAVPGEQPIGVYTQADGEIETIDLEFHTNPSITVVDASEERVTVDVALPVDGFVAVETNETVFGTSDALEPGEHDDVDIDLDENATVNGSDNLTAVVYEGDPEGAGTATPFEPENGDNQRVDAPVPIGEDDADGESDPDE